MSLERSLLKVGERGAGAPKPPSHVSGGASPGVVTTAILAFDRLTDKLLKLCLQCGDIPTRSLASLEKALLNRGEEEAALIELAGAQLDRLRLMEAVEEDPRWV